MVPLPNSQPTETQTICATDVADETNSSYNLTADSMPERKVEINISEIIKGLRGIDRSQLVWRNIIIFIIMHTICFRALYWICVGEATWQIVAFCFFNAYYAALSVTMGAHRLWAHRTYKANFIVRLWLAYGQTLAIQNDIYEWCRDHRVHHKFSDTNADPHNSERGFFFAHMGWLMMKKHPDVKEKGKTVDFSDLLEDPIVYYQRKYYIPLVLLIAVVIPVLIPYYFWGEPMFNAFMATVTRYTFNLHSTWTVNSFAHWAGTKPYDKRIYPVEVKAIGMLGLGEGWHNYHHAFPYDYRASEYSGSMKYNVTSLVIEMFSKIGWTWDLKTVPKELAIRRANRTGDGTCQLEMSKKD